jgi:ATP-dependent Lon protease
MFLLMFFVGVTILDKTGLNYWAHDPKAAHHFTAVEELETWTNLEIDAQLSFDYLIKLIDQQPNQAQTQKLIALLFEGQFESFLKICAATRLSTFFKFCKVISSNHPFFTSNLLYLVKDSKTKEACVFMDRLYLLQDMKLLDAVFAMDNLGLVKKLIEIELESNEPKKEETTSTGLVLASAFTDEVLRLTRALSRYPTLMPEMLEVNDYLDLIYDIRERLMYVFNIASSVHNHDENNANVALPLPFPMPASRHHNPVAKKEANFIELLLGASMNPHGNGNNAQAKAHQAENPLNLLLLPLDGGAQGGNNGIDVEKIMATKEGQAESDSYQWVSDETLNNMDYSDYSRETFSKAKKHIQSISPMKPRLKMESLDVFDSLYDELPNFEEVIDFYKGNFILNQTKPKSAGYQVPTPILLVGPPGIGKTHFAESLAKCLATDSYFLDSNSITASWVLSGSSPTWKEANIGYIFKYINECKTASPVVIFDEIDKLSSNKSYDPFSTFHQLLEPLNAKKFRDEFLNLTFDASKFVYVLSANEINQIPDSLLSRMKVFHIQKPSEEQVRKIAQNMYTKLLDGSQLYKAQLSEENLAALSQYSPREIKQVLMDSVYSQAVKCKEKVENDLFIKSKHEKTKIGF